MANSSNSRNLDMQDQERRQSRSASTENMEAKSVPQYRDGEMDEDDEEETLLRLSGLTRRRRASVFDRYELPEHHEEEQEIFISEDHSGILDAVNEEEGFDGEIDIEPSVFLRRLIQTRSMGIGTVLDKEAGDNTEGNEEGPEDEDEDEEGEVEDDDEEEEEGQNQDRIDDNHNNNYDEGGDEDEDEDEDDDIDDDDPRAEFLRAIGALSSAGRGGGGAGHGLEDVVQRLMNGSAMFGGSIGGMRGGNNGEMEGLINSLNQRDNTYIILETLNELSERLLMMNGITAERYIPANKLAKSLINIMGDPLLSEELELHLVACRCLYNFLEVNQDFIHDALNNNAIEALCSKLLEITYIDLTEQALQTLEMISRDPISHNQIIANNGLKACLQYLDFLTIHAQRKCLTIVSNACTNVSSVNYTMVDEVFGNIADVVSNHTDAVVVENGWLAISRIIISFKLYPDLLDHLFGNRASLLRELTQIIYMSCNKSLNTSADNDSSKVSLNYSSLLSLLKSLIVLSSVSIKVSKILLSDCSIGETIVKSLNKYLKSKPIDGNALALQNLSSDFSIDNISIVALMAAPKDLIAQFLILIGYLLPISYSSRDTPYLRDDHQEFKEKERLNQHRIELCKEMIPDAYWKFVNDIWSLLINSFLATMDFEIRKKVFIAIFRIVSFIQEGGSKNIRGIEMITSLLAAVANQSKGSISKDFLVSNASKILKSAKGRSAFADGDVEMLSSEDEADHESCDVGKEAKNEFEAKKESGKIQDQNDEDEQEDESKGNEGAEDDEDENVDDIPSHTSYQNFRTSTTTQESSKVHSYVLCLSSLLIGRSLIWNDPALFTIDLEKEGFINDTLGILKHLEGNVKNEIETRANGSLPRISASYTNKLVDTEFTDDFEYNLTDNQVLYEILLVAKEIKDLYTTSKTSGAKQNIPPLHLKILIEIGETLKTQNSLKQMKFDDWIELWNQLKYALNGASSNNQISSFELMSSGIIEALALVFTSENNIFGFEFSDCYKTFINVFFVDSATSTTSKSSYSVLFLVSKLQEALTRSESFEIVSSGGGLSNGLGLGSFNSQEHSQTAIMAKQVKIKLLADNFGGKTNSQIPPNMQNMILSVHAIATFKSVDTFLKQRFRFLEELRGEFDHDSGNDIVDEDADNSDHPNIEFLINDEVIPNEITIYGAVYRSLQGKPDEIIDPSKIWSAVHNVSFRRVNSSNAKESKFTLNSIKNVENENDIYDGMTHSILKLLKVLFEMNNFIKNNVPTAEAVPDSNFMNWKLTVKLNRQLEEPLVVASGTLPGWCIHATKQFPFVFPLETRMFFLQSTSFGYSRLIHHWQIRTNQANEDNGNSVGTNQRPQLGRPTRRKVRLSRKMILQSAVKVLGLYGSTPGILEIEYFDEVGSGLGPTLEFYSTVSKEFAKKKLKLWRDHDSTNKDEDAHVFNECGLFPSPLDKTQITAENGKKVLYFFASLGKFIARALLDSRIIDFNFNPVFLKLVQHFNQNEKSKNKDWKKMATILSLRLVDPKLASSMDHLLKYLQQFSKVDEKEKDEIEIDGATVAELSIYFELPGYPEYELLPGGSEIQVTASNLETYVNKVLEATLYSGIVHQTKAFMDGFSKVFPINSLVLFSPQELVELFGNAEEDWSYDTLSSAINANHGYTKESDAIKSLVDILVEFDESEKRLFLQFLTGAPKLPIGGFKALRPELTVVRKRAEDNLKDDDYLPSVMTCANYLKLPSYSTKKLMKGRLLQAINDGAGAFLLS